MREERGKTASQTETIFTKRSYVQVTPVNHQPSIVNRFSMKPIFKITFLLCFFAAGSAFAQKNGYTVRNLEIVNSEFNDFHAIPYQNKLIVTTAREKQGIICVDPELKDELYADLYFSDKKPNGDYQAPYSSEGEIKIKYHDAVPTVHPNQKLMVYTRSYVPEPDLKVLQLFTAERVDSKWTNVKPLPFNTPDFSDIHPTFSADGKTLYFASNRPPGKDKDYNLWSVSYDNGKWGEMQILRGEINSPGTEYFPFIDDDGRLFFASNGHKGYGGVDIFMSVQKDGLWSKPESLPRPINSRFDDFSYNINDDGISGFLCSNRNGGKGADDVWVWKNEEKPIDIQLIVTNAETDIQLEDADIVITPLVDKIPNTVFLDADKLQPKEVLSKKKKPIEYTTVPNGMYKIDVNKPGFEPFSITVSAEELEAVEVYSLPLVPIKVMKDLAGVVLNVQTLEPIASARVVIKNTCDEEVLNFITAADGSFATQIDADCNYDFRASKADLVDDFLTLSSKKIKANPEPTEKITLKLAPPVEKGLVIVVEDVYYDFDKANIRPDAAIELEKVVRLMNRYPSMEIELGSHTDARGKDDYNLNLSQRRADSAVEYIISRGIARNRITARGYGETRIQNRCSNGVQCTEAEHQVNRRTEITVTELKAENVEVRSGK